MGKLSIITINYNDKEGLEKTVNSVLAQTFRDFQYVVIDGGSTDGSKEVLDKYAAQLDVAISEKDSGIYNAMNKGASHATGEYLLFLNSGDTLYDNSTLEQVFKTKPQTDIVSCRCLTFNERHSSVSYPPENISLYTFIDSSLPHPSTFIRRSLFERVGGYREDYKIISDWCFFVDALLVDRCSYSTRPIIVSRFNCFGISSTSGYKELGKANDFLRERFGRIMNDYAPIEDEAFFNCVYWISGRKGALKKVLKIPFIIFNLMTGGRHKLSRRISAKRL